MVRCKVAFLLPWIAPPLLGQTSAVDSASIKLSGYLQAREVYQQGTGLTGSINRARLSVSGRIIEAITWRVQGEFRTGSVGTGRATVSLQDAYVRYQPGKWAVQVGQFKTPFSREFTTSLADLETADRSTAVDSLTPKRDIGFMGEYSLEPVKAYIGLFNGEGQNVTANPDSAILGVARLVVRLLPELALGVNTARYFSDSTRYGVDAAYEATWGTLKGEYVGQRRAGASTADDWGWYGLGAVAVSTSLQAVAKYEEFGRPGISTAVRNRAWTAGINIYPTTRNLRLTFDYVSRKVGAPGVRKGRVLAQVQAKF